MTEQYRVLSYYHIVSIENPKEEVAKQKRFFSVRDIKGRIYITPQGINGTISGLKEDVDAYVAWMRSEELYQNLEVKEDLHSDHAFYKMTVKEKKELVALGEYVDLRERGTSVSPETWREMLDKRDANTILLDVRNAYESKVGHFEGAELPSLDTFKEFSDYVTDLKKRVTDETKILMYCTGGIRCEVFSSLLKQRGIHTIFQLHGGVVAYGKKEKTKHWKGKLFVFDDRMTVPISTEENAEVIGKCHHCGEPNERYYNCANMDCNALFLCCADCLEKYEGCCQGKCKEADRRRPYSYVNTPFRKWYHYAKTKKELQTLKKEGS